MTLVRNILIGVVGLVIVLFLVGFLLPREVHVEREVQIEASQETVFALINDFKEWPKWSPWEGLDPDMTMEVTGPDSGVGQVMRWSGNKDVGEGMQKITVSEPYELIENELDFGDMGVAKSFFRIEPAEGGSLVTWGFDTDMGGNPVGRYMGLLMKRWLGRDYDRGLQQLKEAAESGA